MKVEEEARMTMKCLSARGQSHRAIARMLGVSEGTVRYHLSRDEGAVDGRSQQEERAGGGIGILKGRLRWRIGGSGTGQSYLTSRYDSGMM
jgi:hypothetical protein